MSILVELVRNFQVFRFSFKLVSQRINNQYTPGTIKFHLGSAKVAKKELDIFRT